MIYRFNAVLRRVTRHYAAVPVVSPHERVTYSRGVAYVGGRSMVPVADPWGQA
jgi:hypothetical protein